MVAVPSSTSGKDGDEPAERRMFQLTDLTGNHNKFYMVETWPVAGEPEKALFRASWGRVGSCPQVNEKTMTWREVEAQVAEKVRKGYRPVALHRPPIEHVPAEGDERPAERVDPKVAQLVEWVFREAGEHISSYLAVEVDALGQAQIEEGRRLLKEAQARYGAYRPSLPGRQLSLDALTDVVQAYYNTIPTVLPARVDRKKVVLDFCGQFSEQEDRLLQLEAAIATMKERRTHPSQSLYELLGAELRALAPGEPERDRLAEQIARTQVHAHGMKVRDIFAVRIPAEREAYERNRRGASRRELLFHGTRNQNARHILRQGLICPGAPSNGRMLGNGIYLANRASKGANYCLAHRAGAPCMMFVVEAALGRSYAAKEARTYDRPPRGYDSVWGRAGHTRIGGLATLAHDEFVVYAPAQQTIRYLVTFDR